MILGENVSTTKRVIKLSGKLLKNVAVAGAIAATTGMLALKSREVIKDIKDVSTSIFLLIKNSL